MENSTQSEGFHKQHPEDSELENASGGFFAAMEIAQEAQSISDTVLGTDTQEKTTQGFKDLRHGDFLGMAKNFMQATPGGNLIGKLFK